MSAPEKHTYRNSTPITDSEMHQQWLENAELCDRKSAEYVARLRVRRDAEADHARMEALAQTDWRNSLQQIALRFRVPDIDLRTAIDQWEKNKERTK